MNILHRKRFRFKRKRFRYLLRIILLKLIFSLLVPIITRHENSL